MKSLYQQNEDKTKKIKSPWIVCQTFNHNLSVELKSEKGGGGEEEDDEKLNFNPLRHCTLKEEEKKLKEKTKV